MARGNRLDAAFLIILISTMAVAGLSFPGHVHFDTIVALNEGTTGNWITFNPPVISTIWALLFQTSKSVWPILLVQNLFLFGALWLIVRTPERFAAWGLVCLAIAAFWPPLLNYQGVIVKDVSYADSVIFAFALLFSISRRDDQPRWLKRATIFLAIVLLVVGALTRQQGLFSLCIGLIVGTIEFARLLNGGALGRRGFLIALSLNGLWTIVAWSALSFLPFYITGHQPEKDYRVGLYVVMRYDIVGILHFAPGLDTSRLVEGGWDVENLRMLAQDYYSGERTDYIDAHLGENPGRPPGLAADIPFDLARRFESLSGIWVHAIIQHPIAYLAHRIESFVWLLGMRDESKCIPVYVGVPEEPVDIRELLGIEVPRDLRNSKEYELFRSLLDTPIYWHWAYLLLVAGELTLLLVTYRQGDEAIVGLGLSAFIMTMSFLFIGLACDFRYLYFPMTASLVIPIMLAGRRAPTR